jgi:hypothetical protein
MPQLDGHLTREQQFMDAQWGETEWWNHRVLHFKMPLMD